MLPNNMPYPKWIIGDKVIVFTPLPDATWRQGKVSSAWYSGAEGPEQWLYEVITDGQVLISRTYKEDEIWSAYEITK